MFFHGRLAARVDCLVGGVAANSSFVLCSDTKESTDCLFFEVSLLLIALTKGTILDVPERFIAIMNGVVLHAQGNSVKVLIFKLTVWLSTTGGEKGTLEFSIRGMLRLLGILCRISGAEGLRYKWGHLTHLLLFLTQGYLIVVAKFCYIDPSK